MNTRSGPTASIETLDIFPPTPTTSPYITKSDLDNGIKAINNIITAMISRLIDINSRQNKQYLEWIELKEKHHDELRKISSGTIQSDFFTMTSEHPSSEDQYFKRSS